MKIKMKWRRRHYFGSAWYVKGVQGIVAGELDIRHSGHIVGIRLTRDTFQEHAHEGLSSVAILPSGSTSAPTARTVLGDIRMGDE